MVGRTEAYVDTSALIAFVDRSDSYHILFRRLFAHPPKLVTTTLVAAEGHGWFLKRYDRVRGLEFLAMLEAMRQGSVIVDLAVEMGGNIEGSVSGETVEVNGVKIIGEPNLPALCPEHASRMFGRNVSAFLELIVKEGKLEPDWEDECVQGTAVTHDGELIQIAVTDDLVVPEKWWVGMVETVVRANFGLPIGRFDFDMSSG